MTALACSIRVRDRYGLPFEILLATHSTRPQDVKTALGTTDQARGGIINNAPAARLRRRARVLIDSEGPELYLPHLFA
jgi:hypothetical protein